MLGDREGLMSPPLRDAMSKIVMYMLGPRWKEKGVDQIKINEIVSLMYNMRAELRIREKSNVVPGSVTEHNILHSHTQYPVHELEVNSANLDIPHS